MLTPSPCCLQIAFVQRSDNVELMAICQQAILVAKLELISYIEIPYASAGNISAIAAQLNSTVGLDAVVGCMTSSEAASMYKLLDKMMKPIKNLCFVNGPNDVTWNTELGALSKVIGILALM